MKLNVLMTLFLRTVLLLVSAGPALADSQNTSNLHLKMNISRSTNLIDFNDGSRSDGMDYELSPSLKIPWGTVSTSVTYSQDLRNQYSTTASDFGDMPVAFTFAPTDLKWTTISARLIYTLLAIVPVSKKSVKKDELKTALGGRVALALTDPSGQGFSYGASLGLNQNFHTYEEDINGAVLSKYTSTQSLSCGYTYELWSLSLDAINRTRWTYQNNVKSTFELAEELAYSLNPNIGLALGHTNGGSPLKPNGSDSNIELINENTSMIYGSLTLVY